MIHVLYILASVPGLAYMLRVGYTQTLFCQPNPRAITFMLLSQARNLLLRPRVASTSVRTLATSSDNRSPPGNDLLSYFRSYLDVQRSMRNGGASFAHNLFTALALEVVKARIDPEYKIAELCEGTTQVVAHVTDLLNQQDYEAVASLCVLGPGRAAADIRRDVEGYGLVARQNGDDAVLTCEVVEPGELESLQFDFEGYLEKSLHPDSTLEYTIVDSLNGEASSNVRATTESLGMQGLGEHLMDSDMMVMASVYVPARIRMLSSHKPIVVETSAEPPSLNGGEVEEVEVDAGGGGDGEGEGEGEEGGGGGYWHESNGVRIILQSDVLSSSTRMNWKLLHVDMGVLRFQDKDPDVD